MHVLMLLTDGFGGFGGISKFNRDFLIALDASPLVTRVYAWPRLISEQIEGLLPESIVYERKFAGSKLTFLKHVAVNLFTGPRVDLVVCGHLNLLPVAWLVAKSRRAKLSLIIHGIDAWQPTKNALTNFLAGKIDALVSVSQVSADRFSKWSLLPKDKCSILPNCVDLDVFKPGPKPPELLARYNLFGDRVLLTVGRLASLERYKGFDEVIASMPELLRKFPNLKYLIVGDGPDLARLQAKARTLGIYDNIVFAGRISEEEKVDHYGIADAFVMPSSGEGFGIVLIEAAACGIPAIGSTSDGSREALLYGRLGSLVDPHSQQQIVDAVTAILLQNEAHIRNPLVETFGVAAYRRRVADWVGKYSIAP